MEKLKVWRSWLRFETEAIFFVELRENEVEERRKERFIE